MRKLWVRLSAIFLLLSMLVVVVVGVVMSRSIEDSFRDYLHQSNNFQSGVQVASSLESYYRDNTTWEGVEAIIPGPGRGNQAGVHNQDQGEEQRPGEQRGGVQYTVMDRNGTIVYSREEASIGARASDEVLNKSLPIETEGETVGWVFAETPGQAVLDEAQRQFLQDIRSTMLGVGLVTSLLALLIGILFSQVITRPLDRLRNAAEGVAGGQLGKTVAISSLNAEEITSLAGSFNSMSQALADGERHRQQMTADIAHELRTPVSVIRTQLQAMMDGIHEPSLEHIASAYDQSIHLARLVEDLRTLTHAESGHLPLEKESIDPEILLAQTIQSFEPLADDAGITLTSDIPSNLPKVEMDRDRIQQVLANLLTNALLHTIEGGTIRLSGQRAEDYLRISVANSGVTLTESEAERVFDRFWRGDGSRQRDSGGSGLGLSIARQIIRLHGGRMWVDLTGDRTQFIFEIPL